MKFYCSGWLFRRLVLGNGLVGQTWLIRLLGSLPDIILIVFSSLFHVISIKKGAGCVGQAPALVLEGIARYMDSQCFFDYITACLLATGMHCWEYLF